MAKISFSDLAKTIEGEVHFTLGNTGFDLSPGQTIDTVDEGIIAAATGHPLLKVEAEAGDVAKYLAEEAARLSTSVNPHENPRADHLSAVADPEVVKAAQEHAEHVRRVAAGLPDEAPAEEETTPAPDPLPVAPAPAPDNPPAPAPVADQPTAPAQAATEPSTAGSTN